MCHDAERQFYRHQLTVHLYGERYKIVLCLFLIDLLLLYGAV